MASFFGSTRSGLRDGPGCDFGAGAQLICAANRHLITLFQVSEDFDHGAGAYSGFHVYPFRVIVADPDNEGTF